MYPPPSPFISRAASNYYTLKLPSLLFFLRVQFQVQNKISKTGIYLLPKVPLGAEMGPGSCSRWRIHPCPFKAGPILSFNRLSGFVGVDHAALAHAALPVCTRGTSCTASGEALLSWGVCSFHTRSASNGLTRPGVTVTP